MMKKIEMEENKKIFLEILMLLIIEGILLRWSQHFCIKLL